MIINKNEFLKRATKLLEKIDMLAGLPSIPLKDLKPEQISCIVI